jgi:hypothetical protein
VNSIIGLVASATVSMANLDAEAQLVACRADRDACRATIEVVRQSGLPRSPFNDHPSDLPDVAGIEWMIGGAAAVIVVGFALGWFGVTLSAGPSRR